jgi:hypothetical protein
MDDDGAAPPVSATPVATPALTPEPPAPRWRRLPVRVTSEFDGERRLFSHRFNCRVLDGLAKLRLRISHGAGFGGGVSWPEVGLISLNFSVVVGTASRGAVLRSAADLASSMRLRASHNTRCDLFLSCRIMSVPLLPGSHRVFKQMKLGHAGALSPRSPTR